MKKIKIILCAAVVALFATACINPDKKPIETSDSVSVMNGLAFHLIYNDTTKILYIKGHYNLTPYISANGHYCRYIDGEIVEVTEND